LGSATIFVVSAQGISGRINFLQLLKGFLMKAFVVLGDPIWMPNKHQIFIRLVDVRQ
jgi:hypothetical protein